MHPIILSITSLYELCNGLHCSVLIRMYFKSRRNSMRYLCALATASLHVKSGNLSKVDKGRRRVIMIGNKMRSLCNQYCQHSLREDIQPAMNTVFSKITVIDILNLDVTKPQYNKLISAPANLVITRISPIPADHFRNH